MRKLKQVFLLVLSVGLLVGLIPMEVRADMGPKPSVVIDIEGLTNEVYYGTLLSERPCNGPIGVMGEAELEAKQDEEE